MILDKQVSYPNLAGDAFLKVCGTSLDLLSERELLDMAESLMSDVAGCLQLTHRGFLLITVDAPASQVQRISADEVWIDD